MRFSYGYFIVTFTLVPAAATSNLAASHLGGPTLVSGSREAPEPSQELVGGDVSSEDKAPTQQQQQEQDDATDPGDAEEAPAQDPPKSEPKAAEKPNRRRQRRAG